MTPKHYEITQENMQEMIRQLNKASAECKELKEGIAQSNTERNTMAKSSLDQIIQLQKENEYLKTTIDVLELDIEVKVKDITNLREKLTIFHGKTFSDNNADQLAKQLLDARAEIKIAYNKGWQEGWSNAVIPWSSAQAALRKELADKTEALESIKNYFCACSIDDEIIPQVVAHEVLAKYKGGESG